MSTQKSRALGVDMILMPSIGHHCLSPRMVVTSLQKAGQQSTEPRLGKHDLQTRVGLL